MKIFCTILAALLIPNLLSAGSISEIAPENRVALPAPYSSWISSTSEQERGLIEIQAFLDREPPKKDNQQTLALKILALKGGYKVQITGTEKDKKKILRFSFFPASYPQNWRQAPVEVKDGGFHFWRIFYDPETKKVMDFQANGEA